MLKSVAFISYYQKETICNMNAIAAALETEKTKKIGKKISDLLSNSLNY